MNLHCYKQSFVSPEPQSGLRPGPGPAPAQWLRDRFVWTETQSYRQKTDISPSAWINACIDILSNLGGEKASSLFKRLISFYFEKTFHEHFVCYLIKATG